MREQAEDNGTIQNKQSRGWFNWAAGHPGIMLLGALVVAIVALQKVPEPQETDIDPGGEEVPLFI